MFQFSTTIQGLFSCFTRNKLKVVLSLGAISGLAACYTTYHTDPEERRHLTVCLTDETEPAQCKKPLQVSVIKNAAHIRDDATYITAYDGSFRLELPSSEWSFPSSGQSHKKIWIDFPLEPFSERYARFMQVGKYGSGFGWAVDRTVGSLKVVKEIQDGEVGADYLAPKTGNEKIYFQCAKPYHAIAGNLVTDLGCIVTTEMQPHVLIHYLIKNSHLQDWKRINDQMVREIQSVMKATEGSKQWAT